MPSSLQPLVKPIIFALIVLGLYGLLRLKRSELVDFVVPRTAAIRFLAHEPLYRPDDGHYQYKYFPAFAMVMVPFAVMPKGAAEFTWFTLTVAMTWALVRLAIRALPERRRSTQVLTWLTLLLTGKFLVKELAFGQFNLPLALLLVGAVMAAQSGRGLLAGAAVGAGVFVKPYALVLVPWLAYTLGWRPLAMFAVVLMAGLLMPALFYGWEGNITLMREWYRTVTETIGPNLMGFENISFASMWAKWLEPGPVASQLALVTTIVTVGIGCIVLLWRRAVREPNYLEVAYFLVLVPLISPQGWDYVLIVALPAYVCLTDRFYDLSPSWRVVAALGLFLTSFTIWDVLRRTLYTNVMQMAGVSIGALLIAACLVRLRWRAVA